MPFKFNFVEWVWLCLASSLPTTPAPSILTNPFPNPEWFLSFAMKNPWLYLRSPAKMEVLDSRDQVLGQKTLSPFFLHPHGPFQIPERRVKKSPIFNVTFDYDANTGIVTLKNPDSLKLRFSQSFVDFLGTPPILDKNFTITALKARSAMYVYCDLVDHQRNLLNGGKTNLLVLLHGFAPYFSSMAYHSSNKTDFRNASSSKMINSVSLWIKDEDGALVDFHNHPYSFELAFENC